MDPFVFGVRADLSVLLGNKAVEADEVRPSWAMESGGGPVHTPPLLAYTGLASCSLPRP